MDQKEKEQDQQEQENEQDQQEQGPEHLQNTMQEFAHWWMQYLDRRI